MIWLSYSLLKADTVLICVEMYFIILILADLLNPLRAGVHTRPPPYISNKFLSSHYLPIFPMFFGIQIFSFQVVFVLLQPFEGHKSSSLIHACPFLLHLLVFIKSG